MEIPEAVWGAAIGAVIALTGVGLQLMHDRLERERERRLAAKKDVFLEASEALATASSFLASFSQTDIPVLEKLASFREPPGWLNKLHIFASYPTLSAVAASGNYFNNAISELVKKRFALEKLTFRLSEKQRQREQLVGHQQQLESYLRGLTSQPPGASSWEDVPRVWSLIQKAQERLEQLNLEVEELNDRRLLDHIELNESALHHAGEFQRTLIATTNEIRREISEPLDAEAFASLVEDSVKVQEGALQRTIASLKDQ